MKRYIIAHDLGTSGNKASLFDVDGKLLGSQVVSYDVQYFNGSWAEQDADDWWRAVCDSSKSLIAKTGVQPEEIGAVSFSGQMMGCLCVDRQGRPLRKSIIWADTRALQQQARMEEKISQEEYYHIVGHRISASYGMFKLMWVRDNEPEIYEQTYKTLNAKDYIVFKLTGRFYSEYSDANGMGCFDLKNLQWSERLLSYAGVDPDKLPQLQPSTFVAGGVTKEAAAATGLSEGTPVVLGAGDGLTANVGAGSISPGKTYCSMGTSAWIAATTEQPVFDPQMRTVTWAHAVPGLYSPNGTMQSAGGSYSWLKNTICRLESEQALQSGRSPYDLINEEIDQSPVGANGVLYLPYLLGERAPRWNPDATGSFLGLKAENTRNDLLRSVLEGVTMNLAIVLDILKTGTAINEIMVIGGGGKGATWRQIMADIYNTRITVPAVLEEAGSMGAAVIGGVGAGLFEDFRAIDRFLDITAVHEPDPAAVEAYRPIRQKFDACYHALETVYPLLRK